MGKIEMSRVGPGLSHNESGVRLSSEIVQPDQRPSVPEDVHTRHCCVIHGCKYGNVNSTCTVVEKNLPIANYEECQNERDGHVIEDPVVNRVPGLNIRQNEAVLLTRGKFTGSRGKIINVRGHGSRDVRLEVETDGGNRIFGDASFVHVIDPKPVPGGGNDWWYDAVLFMAEDEKIEFIERITEYNHYST